MLSLIAPALTLVIAANLFFYYRWGWIYLAAIPVAATIDFLLARAIPARRWLIWISVLLNIGLLAIPKLPATANILRLSLSFYAFQALSYTIDVYRGDSKPTTSWIRHLASVTSLARLALCHPHGCFVVCGSGERVCTSASYGPFAPR